MLRNQSQFQISSSSIENRACEISNQIQNEEMLFPSRIVPLVSTINYIHTYILTCSKTSLKINFEFHWEGFNNSSRMLLCLYYLNIWPISKNEDLLLLIYPPSYSRKRNLCPRNQLLKLKRRLLMYKGP